MYINWGYCGGGGGGGVVSILQGFTLAIDQFPANTSDHINCQLPFVTQSAMGYTTSHYPCRATCMYTGYAEVCIRNL